MTLILSAALWQQALAELRVPPHNRERVAYLDGPKIPGPLAVATTLTIPNADAHEGYFDVPPEEMSLAGRHLKAFDMRRLAQIHTHPFGWVGHSEYDDERPSRSAKARSRSSCRTSRGARPESSSAAFTCAGRRAGTNPPATSASPLLGSSPP